MQRGPRKAKSTTAKSPTAPAPVAWRDGVQLGGTVVWCDAGRARDLMFLSHAHVAARAAHGKVLATARTLELLRAAGSAVPGEVLVTPFGRPFFLGGQRLELYPSGHVPGAASLLLTEPSGRRIAYAGDVNPAGGGLAEAAEVRGADVLVLEAPLAALEGALPPRAEVKAELVSLVRQAIASGRTPVVLSPVLGVAEEALCALAGADLPVRAHPRIAAFAAAYRSIGIALPPLARASGRARPGEALLVPPDPTRLAGTLARLVRPFTIALTGLALAPNAASRLGVDAALPLCDHADLDALLRYIGHSEAREVYLTAGFSERVRATLGARGVAAHPLGPPRQMELFGAVSRA